MFDRLYGTLIARTDSGRRRPSPSLGQPVNVQIVMAAIPKRNAAMRTGGNWLSADFPNIHPSPKITDISTAKARFLMFMDRVPVSSGARSTIGSSASFPEFIFQNGGSNNRLSPADRIRRCEGAIEGTAVTEINGSVAPSRRRSALRPTVSEMGTYHLGHALDFAHGHGLAGQANGVPDGIGKGVPLPGNMTGSGLVAHRHRTGFDVDAEATEPCAGLAVRMC